MSYSKKVLADSPQAFYKLNQASGSSITDSSGNSRTGTYNSIVSYQQPVNWAYLDDGICGVELDGSTSYLDLGSSSYLNGAAQVTVEFFARFLSIPGTNLTYPPAIIFIQSQADDWRAGLAIYLNNNTIKVQARTSISEELLASYSFTDTTNWHHFVFHIDYSGDFIYVYIDGIRVISQASAFAGSSVALANNILVGKYLDADTASVFSQFMIADLAIYKNTAFGWVMASKHYHGSGFPYSSTILSNSPAIYWKFNETSGSSVIDYSGNNRGATAANILAYSQANVGITTEVSTGMSSNGTTTIVSGPNTSFLSNITNLAISFWFKATSTSGTDVLMVSCQSSTAANVGFAVGFNSNTLKIFMRSVGGDTLQVANIPFTDTASWHHAFAHWDWANRKMLLILDGVPVIDAFVTTTNTYFTPGNNIRVFGYATSDVANANFSAVSIANMAWYVNTVTAYDGLGIKSLVYKHWFGSSGKVTIDRYQWHDATLHSHLNAVESYQPPLVETTLSQLQFHAPVVNQTYWSTGGYSQQGTYFNKTYARFRGSWSLDFSLGFSFVVSARVKENSNSGILFYHSRGGIHDAIILGHAANSLDAYLKIYDDVTEVVSLTATNALSKTKLTVLAVVFDPGAQTVSLYVDGVRAASTSYAQALPTVTRNYNVLGSGPKATRYERPDPYFNQVQVRQNWNCSTFFDQMGMDYTTIVQGVKGQYGYYTGSLFCSPHQSLFGATSLYFNGGSSGAVLMGRDVDPSISDFCIEMWVLVQNYNTSGNWVAIAGRWLQGTTAAETWLIGLTATNSYLTCYFYPANSNAIITDNTAFPLRTWTHVAFTRSGNTFALFKNGVRINTYTSSNSAIPNATNISLGNYFAAGGALGATSTNWFMGYITGFSILRGSAKYTNTFIPQKNMPPGVANIENPNFLLHFDGTNGSTTFVDPCGHTMTAVGNASISTAQSKFGGSSAYFDGTGDAVRCNHTSVASYWHNFTIECWVYPINGGHGNNYSRIFETEIINTGGGINLMMNSNESPARVILHDSRTGGTDLSIMSGSAIPNTTWTHLAVTRKDGVFHLFVNGVDQGSGNANTNFSLSSTKLSIGANNNASEAFYGYIDEFRFINGHALYTQDFSDALQKIPYANGFNSFVEEVYRDYVAAGVNVNTTVLPANSTYFYDYTGKVITASGSPSAVSTSVPAYSIYGLSISFNGSTDYLTYAYSADFDLGTISVGSNFTVEFWVKTTSTNQTTLVTHGLPGSAGTGNKGWAITLNNGTLSFAVGDAVNGYAVYATSSQVITTSQWHCVAVVLDSGVPRIFVDGSLKAGSFTVGSTFVGKVTTNSSDGVRIGASFTDDVTVSPTDFLTGNIWNFRITKDVCRYYTYYHIFKTPYPERNIIDYTNDPFIEFDVLLMDFEGADNSTTFTDRKAHTTAASGAAKISTANYKVGTSSAYFDGTSGCYVNVTCGSEFVLGVDFTIELWVYFTSLTGAQALLSKYVTWSSNVDFYLGKDANHKIIFNAVDSIPLALTSNTTLVANQWYHIAVTRIGYHTKLFVNGILDTIYTASGAQSIPNDQVTLRIGANHAATPAALFTGYIDNLRIGTICRYALYDGFPVWSKPFTGGITLDIPFTGDHNSTVFYDVDNKSLVRNGTPVISTTQYKTGGSSGYFNGTLSTDYLALPASKGNLANRFTIECWCWPASIPTTLPSAVGAGNHRWDLFGQGGSSGNQDQYFAFLENRKFNFYRGASLSGGALNLTSTNAFAIQTWHHVALTSDGTTWRLFVDGNLEASATNSTSWVNTGNTFDVGRQLVAGAPTWASYWYGYIDNFRITNGVCKYTASFTPDDSPWVYESCVEEAFNGWLSHYSAFIRPLSVREIQKITAEFKNPTFIKYSNTYPLTLMRHLSLAESEGSVAYDIFNGGHGTYNNGVTLNQNVPLGIDNIGTNLALLDGTNDTITLPKLKLGSEFTICLICKVVGATLNQRIMELTSGSFALYVDAHAGEFNVLKVAVKTAGGYQIVSTNNNDYNLSDKNLITITAKESDYLSVYANGLLLGTPIALTTFALNSPYLNVLGASASGANFANIYVSNLAVFNSAFDQSAITAYKATVFSANITSSKLLRTLEDFSTAYYQSLYYISGTVRIDAIPSQAWIYIYCSESGVLEGCLKSELLTGAYEWRTTNNKYYNVLCMPIYNQKDWLANTVYAAGDIVIPFVSTGYYYVCIVGGTSSSTAEPIWPVLINATVVDNTVTWKCADVLSRGQVHGPLLPYDLNRYTYLPTLTYYPAENITIYGTTDSGYTETINGKCRITLNGNSANAYAGVNAVTDTLSFDPVQLAVSVAFKRTASGNWYDDDFTDGQFTLTLVVDRNPVDVVFSDWAWGYYSPNVGNSFRVNFRATATTLGINGSTSGVTVSNGGFTSGAFNGTSTIKLAYAWVGGAFNVAVYENDVLKYSKNSVLSCTEPTSCYFIWHFHNYVASPHQELLDDLSIVIPT